jgi:ATP-dependent DNA helicase RecQ
MRQPLRVVQTFDRPNLRWSVSRTAGHTAKIRTLLALLKARRGASIVYASTRRAVEAVRMELAGRGLPAHAYHAGLSSGTRSDVQGRFLTEGAPVVVATNAFGMGIDRPDVGQVFQYQLPGSLEAYYQEAGRAGRDGLPAQCAALFDPGDRRVHDGFVAAAYPGGPLLSVMFRALEKEVELGERRRVSLSALRRRVGKGMREDGLAVALGALSRAGVIRLMEDEWTDAGARWSPIPPRVFEVTLLRPHLPLRRLDKLGRVARAQIGAVASYARAKGCRRRILLRYFGEEGPSGPCGMCDGCRGLPDLFGGSIKE